MIKKLFRAPLKGFSFFIKKPELWSQALAWTLGVYLYFFGLIIFLLKVRAPANFLKEGTLANFYPSLAWALGLSLAGWFFGVSVLYTFVVLRLFSKITNSGREYSLLSKVKKSFNLLYQNGCWRVFWVIFVFLAAYFFGPFSIVLFQVALAHIALLDSFSLNFDNSSTSLPKNSTSDSWGFAGGGVLGGLFGFFCVPTIIVWLFWLPSLYIGIHLLKHEGDVYEL